MANDLNLTDIQRVEAKLDLIFGILSNQMMASQAIEAYQATADKTDENSIEIKEKSEQAFRHHNKNMIDSVDYYIALFGKDSNDNLVDLLRKAGFRDCDNPQPENTTAPDVKVSTSRKSVEVGAGDSDDDASHTEKS